MNLGITIASRGRPIWLIGALTSLWRLRSGDHNIAFLVGIDEGDEESVGACAALAKVMPLEWRVRPRPPSLGAIHNALLAEMVEADLVSTWIDRVHCLTLDWDEGLAQTTTAHPNHVLWWSAPQELSCIIPIWPKSYLAAAQYKWTPEIFPFWFDDVWLMQVERLVCGGPSLKAKVYYGTERGKLGIERGKTTRGRDFAFWGDVFRRTLPLRIGEAQKMCRALGVPWHDRPELIQEFERDALFFAEKATHFENLFGDGKEPGPDYLAARAAAERLLMNVG